MPRNAAPAVARLLGSSWDSTVGLYDRAYQKPDPDGDKNWDTMRDLDRVWAAERAAGRSVGRHNTLMIDDTYRKMREHPDNMILVSTLRSTKPLRVTWPHQLFRPPYS